MIRFVAMADLCIDFDALQRVRTHLDDVSDLLKGPCKGMADLPADAAGHDDLRSKLRDFGDEWDFGIGKLAEFSGGAAEALTTITDTFQQLDSELAKAFEQQPQD